MNFLDEFKFGDQINRLDEGNLLYLVLSKFTEIDLHPDVVDNIEMGYILRNSSGDSQKPRMRRRATTLRPVKSSASWSTCCSSDRESGKREGKRKAGQVR